MTKYAKCGTCGYTIEIPDAMDAGDYVCPVDGTTLEVATRTEYMVMEKSTATFVVAASDSLHKERADYVCDGVDDQVEIQAAIGAVAATGGTISFCEGTYNLAALLMVLTDNIRLIGAGNAVLWEIAANIGAIQFGNATTTVDHCSLENIQIDGNNATYTTTNLVRLYKTTHCMIKDCEVHHASNGVACIDVSGDNTNLLIDHCYVHHAGISVSDADGIEINPTASYVTVQNCVIHNCQDDGIDSDGCSHLRIINNHVYACLDNIELNSTDCLVIGNFCENASLLNIMVGSGSKRFEVSNNTIKGNGNDYGIRIYDSENINVFANQVSYCLYGVHIDEYDSKTPKRNKINGNIIHDNQRDGIYARKVDHCEINDNVIADNNLIEQHHSGIVIDLSSDSIVCGNIVTNFNTGKTTKRGIRVLDSKNISISNNVLSYIQQSPIWIKSSSRCSVTNNQVHATQQAAYGGIYLQSSSYCMVTSNFSGDNQGVPTQSYGITEAETADHNIIANNILLGNVTAPLLILGLNTITHDKHSDLFMDVLAASANHAHAAITGTGAEQEITTAITNPDVPRNISITNSANSTGDVKIDGVDAKGNTVSDTITIVTGGIAYGVVAFVTVSKITIPATVANPDTISVGISDKLGLSNIIYASGDVYKVKVNNADDPTIGTVNTTYGTVDCATINAGDDITIWYKSNLNIIS